MINPVMNAMAEVFLLPIVANLPSFFGQNKKTNFTLATRLSYENHLRMAFMKTRGFAPPTFERVCLFQFHWF